MLKCILYVIFICGIVSSLCVIIWKLCKDIKEIDIIEERIKMNIYDEKNKCFVPNPPAMRYWEIITKISTYTNIPLIKATTIFYDLSHVPLMETLEIILNTNENNLIPFGSKVKICDDEDKILSYGIQPKYAGCIAHITDIVIDEEHDENDKDDITRNRI